MNRAHVPSLFGVRNYWSERGWELYPSKSKFTLLCSPRDIAWYKFVWIHIMA